MRLVVAAGLGALLGGLATAAGLRAARSQVPEPAARPFEVERSATHAIASKRLGRTYDVYVKLPATNWSSSSSCARATTAAWSCTATSSRARITRRPIRSA